MFPNSIRWRLPLSYAAIALLAVLSLGFVLLTILQNFYRQQELDYLTNNAQTISATLAPLVEAGLPSEALQSQLSSYAFLAQTRVQLLDTSERVLADSGNPRDQPQEVLALSVELDVEMEMDTASQMFTQTIALSNSAKNYTSLIAMRNAGFENPIRQDEILANLFHYTDDDTEGENILLKEKIAITTHGLNSLDNLAQQEDGLLGHAFLVSRIPAVGTPYGFGLGSEQTLDGPRSDQVVSQPIYNDNGSLLGYVRLSEGPAYGRQILDSVARGWAIAGVVAVLLAGVAGWGISRRLSLPLLELTAVTTRMAAGNLSVRANIPQHTSHEFDTLAHTFNHMAGRVEETVFSLSRFVADAAHELHTPLTALRTNLELAAADHIGLGSHSAIEQAQAQVARLEALASDLIDLSRLETKTDAVTYTSVDLAALLRDVCEVYASQAEQTGQLFSLQLPEEPCLTDGNEVQLRRAISNLLDNALKFTPNDGRIGVGLRPSPDDNRLEIWVEDTGIGIPSEELPQLFSRFHRGRNAAAYPGSGLGLAIVKAITEGHGGHVTAESTGSGTCFVMHLKKDVSAASSGVPKKG